jgi:hypothetical protein
MNAADLIALADRVEALTGVCRETDAEIAVKALGWVTRPPRYEGDYVAYGYMHAEGFLMFPGNGGGDSMVRRYTASIDAAMSLVPDGATFQVTRRVPGEGCCADIDMEWHANAATPSLALTAAALRARAAILEQETRDERD